ncbi:MAG: DUF748 domain-containing protein [wastewater metagenome]|nr:DUF748 domain-containing protein [Candidatus Loosdrechtia aerotolerans]
MPNEFFYLKMHFMKNILKQWWGKALAGILACVVIFTVVGFFVLPVFIKSQLTRRLSLNLHREVSVKKVKVNPYLLSLQVEDVMIKDKDGEVFSSIDEFFLNLQFSSIFKKALVVKKASVKQPYLRVVRNENTHFNFSDLVEKKERDNTEPLRFSLNEIKVIDGTIVFLDTVKGAEQTISDMNITIPFLSNLPQYTGDEFILSLIAVLNGTPISISGKSRIFEESRRTILHIDIQGLDIPRYSPYLPFNTNITINSGYIDMRTTLLYSQKGNPSPPALVFFQTFLSLDSLVLKHRDEEEDFVVIPEFSIHNADINVPNRKVVTKNIFTKNGHFRLKRFPGGDFNFQDLISSVTGPEEPGKPEKLSERDKPEQNWLLDVKDVFMKEYKIQYEDLTVPDKVLVTLDKINFQARDLTTRKEEKGQVSLSMHWNQNGTIVAEGNVGIDPITADLKISADGVDISPLQPYFLGDTNLTITKANLTIDGNLAVYHTGEKKPIVQYQGMASLSDFASIERVNKNKFLTWKTFVLSGIDIQYNPIEIQVDTMVLDNFSVPLIIHPDGTANVKTILVPEIKEEEEVPEEQMKKVPEPPEVSLPPFKINSIIIENGKINFADRSIDPNFESTIKDIRLIMSGLSSKETRPFEVFLTGKIEDVFPVEVEGKIDLFSERRYIDLNLILQGYDLPPLTPYAGRYLGYTIPKGKLYLNLEYEILGKKLEGKNQIIIEQLALGKKIESQQATSLPIKFAVNFLKDREGKIKMDIPVSGNLGDPQFEIGKIILNSMTNLVTRVATSPLALLGTLFGEGEKLSFVAFDHGGYALKEKAREKLDDLITAMYERPFLRLEIQGVADPEEDRNVFKQRRFINLLKEQKVKTLARRGRPALPLGRVKIRRDEYEIYVKRAYRAADFPRPRNTFGFLEDIPVSEMEKLLLDHIKVTEEELKSLAQKRAEQVRDYIVKSEKIEPERIFLVEPKISQPERDEKGKKSRVQFALK